MHVSRCAPVRTSTMLRARQGAIGNEDDDRFWRALDFEEVCQDARAQLRRHAVSAEGCAAVSVDAPTPKAEVVTEGMQGEARAAAKSAASVSRSGALKRKESEGGLVSTERKHAVPTERKQEATRLDVGGRAQRLLRFDEEHGCLAALTAHEGPLGLADSESSSPTSEGMLSIMVDIETSCARCDYHGLLCENPFGEQLCEQCFESESRW